jgi:Tfp pilus assembly protein PilN
MLQLNLLPDVKQEYIKAENQRRLVISISVIVTGVSIGLLILLLSIGGLQRKHISDLTDDIASSTKELQGKKDIDKILTVQNQLNSLTGLHAAKPAATRMFDYLNQATPTQVDITNIKMDFTASTITITGTADSLSSVNKYVDTIKFTTYTTDSTSTPTSAFSNVVLTAFAITTGVKDGGRPANYTITLSYQKDLFDLTKKVSFNVPNLTTTRASSNPNDLFKTAPSTSKTSGGGN